MEATAKADLRRDNTPGLTGGGLKKSSFPKFAYALAHPLRDGLRSVFGGAQPSKRPAAGGNTFLILDERTQRNKGALGAVC